MHFLVIVVLFSPDNNSMCVAAGKSVVQDRKEEASTTCLNHVCSDLDKSKDSTTIQGGKKVSCLSVTSTHINGEVMVFQ